MKDNKNQSWSSQFNTDQLKNIGNTVNPQISPPEGLFISSPFEGGLNRDEGLILIWGEAY